MKREFYQSHSCEGMSAKITIEWSTPEDSEPIPHRLSDAEDIAEHILAFAGKRMRDMVQAMRGRKD